MATYSVVQTNNLAATGQAVKGVVSAGTARGGMLHSVIVHPGSATASLTIYDNATAASGTILIQSFQAQVGWSNSVDLGNVQFSNGLWCMLSGAGAACTITYE